MMGICVQTAMDLIVAGISLMVGLGFFALIASILCSVAFFHHAKADSLPSNQINNHHIPYNGVEHSVALANARVFWYSTHNYASVCSNATSIFAVTRRGNLRLQRPNSADLGSVLPRFDGEESLSTQDLRR